MVKRPVRMFIGAVLVAVLGMFGTGAQARQYGVVFDPFTGTALLDYNCPEGCVIDLLNADIVSTVFPGSWVSGPQYDIATGIMSSEGGDLIAFDSIPLLLSPPLTDLIFGSDARLIFASDSPPCTTPSLKFTENPSEDASGFRGHEAQLVCGDSLTVYDTATYGLTAVPEPGTLALILGGAGVAWLTRRRKVVS
jgi:hypothetical protein